MYLVFQGAKDPISSLYRYSDTDPDLFVSYGLIKFLHIPYLDPVCLQIVGRVTRVAWVFAAIGLATRWSAVVTAVGFCFLHGMCMASSVFSHNWFLPMYALIALCFARTSDRFSVDYYISKLWLKSRPKGKHIRPQPEVEPKLADTGFARKLFLVATAGFYFAAGSAKLLTAGHGWHDGHTIHYFTTLRSGSPLLLTHLFSKNLWISDLSSSFSLFFEVGAITMIFSKRSRYLIIPGLIFMHLGIKYSMRPDYTANVICLMLLVNWGSFASRLPHIRRSPSHLKQSVSHLYRSTKAAIGIAGGTGLVLLMLAIAKWQIFWWPLTNVYMYSSYFSGSKDIRADYPRAAYYQPNTAQTIASQYFTAKPNIEATEYFAFRVSLRLAGENEAPLYLYDSLGVSSWKQFVLTLVRPVLIEDFATKPPSKIEFDPTDPDYPAQRFLSAYMPVLRKYVSPEVWQKYQRVELVYPLDNTASESVISVSTRSALPQEVLSKYKRLELADLSSVALVPIASVPLAHF